jgi:HK97 family phage prohead protease
LTSSLCVFLKFVRETFGDKYATVQKMERQPDYIKAIPNAERRFTAEGIAFRSIPDENKKVFRGYAAKFGTISNDLGGFRETIARGFFDTVLGNDVRALRDHEPSMILGRTLSGTCRLGVDDTGLYFEYDDPGTTYSSDLAKSIERGDVTQCSFAFSLAEKGGDKVERMENGTYLRTLLRADRLYDVSVVTFPAYEDTSVASRSISQFKSEGFSDEEKRQQIADALNDLAEMEKDLIERDMRQRGIKSSF